MTHEQFLTLEDQLTQAIRKAILATLESMGERAYMIDWFNSRGAAQAKALRKMAKGGK